MGGDFGWMGVGGRRWWGKLKELGRIAHLTHNQVVPGSIPGGPTSIPAGLLAPLSFLEIVFSVAYTLYKVPSNLFLPGFAILL